MDEFSIALIIIGGTVMALGLISNLLARTILMEPTIALFIGILCGPEVLGFVDPSSWGLPQFVVIEYVARLTLGIGLVAVALRIPKGFPIQNWRAMTVLVGPGMLLMWLSSSFLVYLILGLPFWLAVLTGAVITPTDPIVASSIVTGPVAEENLPQHMRHAISFESGANDGLAYLFVFLPVLFLTLPAGEALTAWLARVVLWELGFALVFGAAAGYTAGKLMVYAKARKLMERHSLLAHTLALSLFVLGASKLLQSDEIVAVFVAGIIFDEVVSSSDQAEEERVQEAVNRFFSLPIFILLGTVIPWAGWFQLGWSGLVLVIAVLFLRRLPALLLLRPLLPGLESWKDALIVGWFGPIAIGALYYAGVIHRHVEGDQVWVIATLVICASTVVHGMSAAPLSLLYGRASGRARKAKN